MPWLSCVISNVFMAAMLALTAWFVQRRLQRHCRRPHPLGTGAGQAGDAPAGERAAW